MYNHDLFHIENNGINLNKYFKTTKRRFHVKESTVALLKILKLNIY